MSRITRSSEEIEIIKIKILDAALAILFEEGFDDLSMRKLGRKLGMTAANIYNYYSGKDELYLTIQTRGFELIVDRFEQINATIALPIDRLSAMITAYLEFGFTHSDYYSVMFSRNTPKYCDYVGSKLEPIAFLEKKAALKVAQIVTRLIEDLARSSNQIQEEDAPYHTIQLWATLHGVISLHYSRVLQELDDNVLMIIQRLKKELIRPFEPTSKENR
ncbi:MAG: TetR/AcrR family transcriptional regulator [Proteobacteria bacterium]|nr:TetR/AcrR family transcriptional regulator [Pseudomonadota bacterium]